jgi:hypothetical protein
VARQRRDFHQKTAREFVKSYDLIVVEDLAIANMLRRPKPVTDAGAPGRHWPNGAAAKTVLNRSISDAGWGQFVSILRAKAEEAGRPWVEVDRGTHLTAARRVGTQRSRTASAKRSFVAGAAATPPTPTNMPHAIFFGLDWPFMREPHENKLTATSCERSHMVSRCNCYS